MGERKIGEGQQQDIREYYKSLQADGKFSQKDLEKVAKRIEGDGKIDAPEAEVLRDIATSHRLEEYNLKPLPKDIRDRFNQIRTNVADPAVLARQTEAMKGVVENSSARSVWQSTRLDDVGPQELFPQLYGNAVKETGSGGLEALTVTPEQRQHRLEVMAKVAAANGWSSPDQMKKHLYEIAFLSTVVEAMERSSSTPGPLNADGSINKAAVRQYYDKHQDEPMPKEPGDTAISMRYNLKDLAHYYGAKAGAEEVKGGQMDKDGTHIAYWEVTTKDQAHTVNYWSETDQPKAYHPDPHTGETRYFQPHRVNLDKSDGGGYGNDGRRQQYPVEFPVKW